jgi:paraquat-inducible protein A
MKNPEIERPGQTALIACHFCGLEQAVALLQEGQRARCARCSSTIRERKANSVDRTLALALCGLALFVPANVYPIMSFEVVGRSNDNRLISGVIGLFGDDAHVVAAMVLATSLLVPLLKFLCTIAVLLPIRIGRPQFSSAALQRLLDRLDRWAMLDIYLLAVAVAYAKLSNFGDVGFRGGWGPLLGIILVSILVSFSYDPGAVREAIDQGACAKADARPRKNLAVTVALLVTAAILFIPSYTWPVLTIVEYGEVHHDTVYGSILELTSGGQYLLGALMFCASIIIPTSKLLALTFLVLSVRMRWKIWRSDRLMLYRIVEAIGRWSFVDLFVVSILIALGELGVFATVTPGPGLIFFAGVVLSTMLAAMYFDPRLIWNPAEE